MATLDPALLAVLACPEDKGPLHHVADEDVLYNPRLGRTYDVVDGIPVMLIEESHQLDEADDARLRARVDADGIPPTF